MLLFVSLLFSLLVGLLFAPCLCVCFDYLRHAFVLLLLAAGGPLSPIPSSACFERGEEFLPVSSPVISTHTPAAAFHYVLLFLVLGSLFKV